ncbi:MAG: anti-phage deoxyguanosine triphosphatase [Rhodobacteraceae bacterium]|nr:anti-phage deoxyguanosine triphosphatase [Paracoccaceae bacterium]
MDADNPKGCDWTARRCREPATDDDYRTPWYRDYGRVVHSASFRRLQAKTQILGVGEGDFHRTRLTHTLEVSQIGESIRKRLHHGHGGKNNKHIRKWLPDSALIRAICLTHDLGHPPFGHDGEVALNRCMLGKSGFEGNGQTLRIITRLEKHTEDHGMNLTRRAVLGAIKYPAPYKDVNNEKAYPNYRRDLSGEPVFRAAGFEPPKCYLDDEDLDIVQSWLAAGLDEWQKFSDIQKRQCKHHTTQHKSLDASIMELADDIAYGVHDLEDAISLRIMDRRMFQEWFEECGRLSAIEPLLDSAGIGPEFVNLVDRLFSRQTHERKQVMGHLVGVFVGAVEIIDDPHFQTPLFKFRVALKDPEKQAVKTLKQMIRACVIERVEVQQLRFKGQKIVTELFHAFATDPKRLLDERDYRRSTKGGGDIPIERVICDYIAGMTDAYATERYRQLFDPRAGSVFDRL